jgi:hypothetical protein
VETDGGIFKLTIATNTWTDALNVGITSHLFYSVGSSPANPSAVIGGLQDNGTRVRSLDSSIFNQQIGGDDDGASWTRWGSGMPLVNVFDLNFANGTLVRGATYGRGVGEIVP